ncbi:MAG: rRNA ((1518)-N(6)/adenine(1519)-N(6))-dimethyltransferase RsmA [Bacteroidota bacterium]|jgi:16S rRNA (adenine1518-N6/adenine1519-N6)-dimethyltransferase
MKYRGGVRPKKSLGQHFLIDDSVTMRIIGALELPEDVCKVLEIGPGMGVLTQHLTEDSSLELHAVELDAESVVYLRQHYPELGSRLIEGDFLQLHEDRLPAGSFGLIGNFPYNISTQILFRVLDLKDRIPVVVGMFQKEVAERIASPPGNRDYGILSVLLQPWYDIEYLFTVNEECFNPPPRVKSGVLRMKRNAHTSLRCSEAAFKRVVKQGFSQRRKTLRNALKPLLPSESAGIPYLDLRAEALTWQQFEELTVLLVKE